MVWSAKVFVVDSVTATSYYFRIPVMEWLCGKSGIPCSQLCFYLDRFTGTDGTFLDKCGILRTGRMADFNGILISAIRHKGIGKTFTALNLLKTFGIAFFSTAFLCDFFMDMIYGNAIQNYVFLSCLVSLLLMVYFYFHQSQLKMQISVLDTQYDLIESQYVRAQNFYTENAKLYHDIKHHLRALERLLQHGDQREALAYIESVQEPLQCKMIPVHTGVDIVDTVIYEAKEKAEQRNILLLVETPILPSGLKLEDREFCVLCANLLNNALEAAKEQIRLNIAITAGFLVIEMKNDYKEKPVVKNNHFVSEREQDSLAHGWGMKIIEQIVGKYQGKLSIRVDMQVSIKILLDVQ